MNDVGANLFELYIDAAEEKGFNKGVEHGIAEGKELEKIQIIKNMIENGATDEMIIKFLNVSEEELKKIKMQILK